MNTTKTMLRPAARMGDRRPAICSFHKPHAALLFLLPLLLHLLQSLSIILQLGFHDHAALQIISNVKEKWFKDLICSLSTNYHAPTTTAAAAAARVLSPAPSSLCTTRGAHGPSLAVVMFTNWTNCFGVDP